MKHEHKELADSVAEAWRLYDECTEGCDSSTYLNYRTLANQLQRAIGKNVTRGEINWADEINWAERLLAPSELFSACTCDGVTECDACKRMRGAP